MNTPASVANPKPPPIPGAIPVANTAGIIMKPANRATRVSNVQTIAVLEIRLSSLER